MHSLPSIAWLVAASVFSAAGEPFTLAVGETVSVDGTNLSLTFTAVTRDSRCPKGVQCIVAGEAIAVFDARLDDEEHELTFSVPPGGRDEQELGGLTIVLVELEPEADSTKKIAGENYVATVVVRAR